MAEEGRAASRCQMASVHASRHAHIHRLWLAVRVCVSESVFTSSLLRIGFRWRERKSAGERVIDYKRQRRVRLKQKKAEDLNEPEKSQEKKLHLDDFE